MAISEDGSTPGAVTGTGTGVSVTTGSFSPPAAGLGAWLVALIALGHPSGAPAFTVSDTGSHTWAAGPAITNGTTTAAIYSAYLPSGASGITVTAHDTVSQAGSMQLDLRVVDGARPSQAGAGSNTSDNGGAASTSWTGDITTTVPGSWAYVACCGNAEESSLTPVSVFQTLNNFQASAGSSCLSGRQSAATVTPGSTALGWTIGGSAVVYSWAALEILPAPGRHLVLLQAVKRSYYW